MSRLATILAAVLLLAAPRAHAAETLGVGVTLIDDFSAFCMVHVRLVNGLDVALRNLQGDVDFRDAAGNSVAVRPFVIDLVNPGSFFDELVGIEAYPGLRQNFPCRGVAEAQVELLGCEGGGDDMTERCLTALTPLSGSLMPLVVAPHLSPRQRIRDRIPAPAARAERAESLAIAALRVTVAAITEDLAERHRIGSAIAGALVTAVDADHGLEIGDVLVELGQEPVTGPDAAASAVEAALAAEQRSILALVVRSGDEHFLVVPLSR